jgi:chromosome segregation ATPase
MMEMYKKINVKNTMATAHSKVMALESNIKDCELSINFASENIQSNKNELVNLKARLDESNGILKELRFEIEETEVAHVRTSHIIEEILTNAAETRSKLKSIQD